MSDSPPETVSLNTLPRLPVQGNVNDLHSPELSGSACESFAIEDHKDTIKDKVEDEEDAWEHDPANPRNWPPAKKWVTISLVSQLASISPHC